MDQGERDKILYRLDERTKRVDGHLRRLDQRVEEVEEEIESHDDRITDNEGTLRLITKAGTGFVGLATTAIAAGVAKVLEILPI